MNLTFAAYWMQKAGNSSEEYEDAFAPAQHGGEGDFRCAVADGATETSFSGLWAQILVDAFVEGRISRLWQQEIYPLALNWRGEIALRTRDKPLPWYAEEKLQRGAFSSLMGLEIRPDGRWRAVCVGDSCLFHIRPQKPIRALPYYQPEQFDNHPLLISTNLSDETPVTPQIARGKWRDGDTFLLMTDALAHCFLSQPDIRPKLASDSLDQAAFEQIIGAARVNRLCRNDDVTLVKVCLGGRRGMG